MADAIERHLYQSRDGEELPPTPDPYAMSKEKYSRPDASDLSMWSGRRPRPIDNVLNPDTPHPAHLVAEDATGGSPTPYRPPGERTDIPERCHSMPSSPVLDLVAGWRPTIRRSAGGIEALRAVDCDAEVPGVPFSSTGTISSGLGLARFYFRERPKQT